MGKINFLQKFILDYAQTAKRINDMIKKEVVYNWGKKENDAFTCIKQAIADAPALYSLEFNKDFLLYTVASDIWLATVLTKKDELKNDAPSPSSVQACMDPN